MNIYIGNLPYTATEEQLRQLFGEHGQVDTVSVITDRQTKRPRGFAFVTMNDDTEAQKAIDALDGKDMDGRALKVNQAKEKAPGPPRQRR